MRIPVSFLIINLCFASSTWVFAQNAELESTSSGVLVSPPYQDQGTEQENTGNTEADGGPSKTKSPSHQRHNHKEGNSLDSSQNPTSNSVDNGGTLQSTGASK